MTWLRALAAAGLSVLLPGAGHVLIRDWVRALAFGGVFVAALAIFLPPADQLAAISSVSDGMTLVTDETDTISQFVLSFIVLFATIDATFRAIGFSPNSSGDDGDGPSCPECGKPLDEELTFCHWCTSRLEPREDEESPAP
ncbi:DUF7575 domain-containing protein [Natronococcus wangiae]|uniref:DUF7575 domain-containing protein n=1 Tax=Natronococcus wangiae TaxID=3068275 RepID=UPI00273D5E96|nr:zinc ribbon domain-containing protein [Natronococcus sp. AD5]